jgi:phenylacetate-CoA ligase
VTILAPEIESRPWAEQLTVDDASYREQLVYLYDRSPFYRDKLTAAGFDSAADAGGLADIARLPLTDKRELLQTCTRDNAIGAHLCVGTSEIVRIYSTSGTTGAPSFIPLTASDLDNWVTGSARSYASSGIEPGQRIVTTYSAGPFAAGAALGAFDRIGLAHIPVGTGNTERLVRAIEMLRPEAAVMTPSYAAYVVEWASKRGVDLPGSTVERVLVAGEPGGGEAAFRAALEEGWNAPRRARLRPRRADRCRVGPRARYGRRRRR